jgi:hypothetical protein
LLFFAKKMRHLGIPKQCVQIVHMLGNNTLPTVVVITRPGMPPVAFYFTATSDMALVSQAGLVG